MERPKNSQPSREQLEEFLLAVLPSPQIDVLIRDSGSILLFNPLTPEAEQWIEDNVSREGFQPDFPSLIVERKYASGLCQAMAVDGLTVRESKVG